MNKGRDWITNYTTADWVYPRFANCYNSPVFNQLFYPFPDIVSYLPLCSIYMSLYYIHPLKRLIQCHTQCTNVTLQGFCLSLGHFTETPFSVFHFLSASQTKFLSRLQNSSWKNSSQMSTVFQNTPYTIRLIKPTLIHKNSEIWQFIIALKVEELLQIHPNVCLPSCTKMSLSKFKRPKNSFSISTCLPLYKEAEMKTDNRNGT